jgi:2-keto-3-deoxy-L-fuconate dehydrogenase
LPGWARLSIATDIDGAAVEALAAGSERITAHRLDVLDAGAVEALIDASPRLDILVNCAGWVHDGTILDCDETAWDRSFDLNAKAMFRLTKAVLPGMLEHGSGSIINIASVVSSLKGAPRRFAYGASKAAIIGMTKAVAADFVKDGIRCNAICPGTVESPSLKERLAATGDFDKAHAAFTARQPMGRFGTPEEIAEMVCYLAGDMSAFTTGSGLCARRGVVDLMRLDRAASIDDLRQMARGRIPRFAFDLVDGGAESERNLRRNIEAFEEVELTPRYMVDVSEIDTSAALFGQKFDAPFGMAPIGMLNAFWPDADLTLARLCKRKNIPYVASSAASTTLEHLAEAADGNGWFQLYVSSDDTVTEGPDRPRRSRRLQGDDGDRRCSRRWQA